MTSKEIIKNKIAGLEDDYQHYTMVDKDKVKAHFIKTDIEEHQQILQDLERKEELEKENQELKELLESCKQGLHYLGEVNEELNYSIDSEIYFLTNELFEQKERNIDLYTRYEKLKKVINFLKHNFSIKLDSKLRISDGLECVQSFLFDKETNEVVYDDVKEVLENDN